MRWSHTLGSFVLGLLLTLGSQTFADSGDTSAHAPQGFVKTIQQSSGMMIKVPIDKEGKENVAAAEMRVFTGNHKVDASTNLKQLWTQGIDANNQPRITSQDISRDSSTWGWYNNWYSGWYNNYYYNYYPSYYSYGYYYNYRNPYYYTYYYPNYSYNYRYYWYYRYW